MFTASKASVVAVLLVVIVCLGACAAGAPAQSTGCPPDISTQQTVVSPPTGWRAAIETTTHRLVSVTFFDGPVEEKASLVNDEQSETAEVRTAIWKFPASPRGYWLSCGYDRTAAVLARQLPPSVSRCEVAYDTNVKLAGQPGIRSMSCR